jgi:hypothetical protein
VRTFASLMDFSHSALLLLHFAFLNNLFTQFHHLFFGRPVSRLPWRLKYLANVSFTIQIVLYTGKKSLKISEGNKLFHVSFLYPFLSLCLSCLTLLSWILCAALWDSEYSYKFVLKMAHFATQRNHPTLLTIKNQTLQCKNINTFTILIVVFPCMLIITQLLFQQNTSLLKAHDITICTFLSLYS